MVLVAVLAAGIPLRLLVPDAWDDLAAGAGQGIADDAGGHRALPRRRRVGPQRDHAGRDAAHRCSPRSSPSGRTATAPRRRAGRPLAAAVVLGVLYACRSSSTAPTGRTSAARLLRAARRVPVARAPARRPGRRRRRDRCWPPRSSGWSSRRAWTPTRPWLDYEQIAEDSSRATHGALRLGPPLRRRWTGRARGARSCGSRPRTSAYWKAATPRRVRRLRWRQRRRGSRRPAGHGDRPGATRTGRRRSASSSRAWSAASTSPPGRRCDILPPRPAPPCAREQPGHAGRPGAAAAPRHELPARGLQPAPDADASCARPATTTRRSRAPLPDDGAPVPVVRGAGRPVHRTAPAFGPPLRAQFSRLPRERAAGRAPVSTFPGGYRDHSGAAACDRSALRARLARWRSACGRSRRRPTTTCCGCATACSGDATYSESPPPQPRAARHVPVRRPRRLLPAVLRRDGAAAAHGRRAGARGLGLQPGRLDRARKEYVVRDLDAHSWVEAYFPGYGWVTFDPTPGAPPARSQTDDAGQRAGGDDARGARPARRRPRRATRRRPARAGGRQDGGAGPGRSSALAAAVLARRCCAAAVVVLVRRGRLAGRPLAPELAELQRALHRSGRTPRGAGRRCAELEAPLGGSPAARGYLRAAAPPALRGRGRRPDGRPAPRAAPRARRGPRPARAPARAGGRCPPASRPLTAVLHCRRWTASTSCSARHAPARAAATTTRRRCRSRARATSSPTRRRSARRWAARCSARSATARPPRSSRRSSSTRRPTTTRSSASGARCSCMGRHAEARHPLALASCLRPERRDYRKYRDQARARAWSVPVAEPRGRRAVRPHRPAATRPRAVRTRGSPPRIERGAGRRAHGRQRRRRVGQLRAARPRGRRPSSPPRR